MVPGGGGPVHPINSLHACYGVLTCVVWSELHCVYLSLRVHSLAASSTAAICRPPGAPSPFLQDTLKVAGSRSERLVLLLEGLLLVLKRKESKYLYKQHIHVRV